MNLGIFNGFVTKVIPRNQYRLYNKLRDRKKLPWLLKLYRDIDAFIPDPNAKVAVWYGAKEPNMKKAVLKLKRAFPALQIHPFEGFGHGEIIAHPELMAEEIKRFINS